MAARATYRKHVVTPTEIVEVFEGSPRYFMNQGPDRRAPMIMVGKTLQGRCIVVPIEPAGEYGVWRPVTAFECNAQHAKRLEGNDQ